MLRFYCTDCKRNKRVARRPDNVHEITDSDNKIVGYTQGTCNSHARGEESRKRINDRGRVLAHLGNTSKMSASAAKSKSKKG